MSAYIYNKIGLDNVRVWDLKFLIDDAGQKIAVIPNVDGLHRAIVTAIVTKPFSMTGKELRFLRTEMGMNTALLAAIIHRETLALVRWESGEGEPIDINSEIMIRLHARAALNLPVEARIRDIASWSSPAADAPLIHIDGSNPDCYEPLEQAPAQKPRRKIALSLVLHRKRTARRGLRSAG